MVDDVPLTVEYWPIDRILPYAANAREHSDEQVRQLAESMAQFGFTNPCLVDADGVLIAGHGRLLAAAKLGLATAPVIKLGYLTPAQARAYRLADNRIALNSTWNEALLAEELAALESEIDPQSLGFDEDEIDRLLASTEQAGAAADNAPGEAAAKAAGSLAERFGVPPFSVLRAAEGWWQKRKAYWIDLGIQSELGRGLGNHAAPGGSMMPGVDRKTGKIVRTDGHARPVAA